MHHAAATGFDRAGAAYERGRPDYPQVAVDLLVARLGIGEGRDVLDLAAGTGKLTRRLVPTGARLVAVEPVAGMRDQLAASLPDLVILNGTAEAIPLADGVVDAVLVGQAFHWFDGAAALAEIARVLRPGPPAGAGDLGPPAGAGELGLDAVDASGLDAVDASGGLGLVWNARDETADWVAALTDLLARHRGDAPQYADGTWRTAFSRTRGAGLFAPLAEAHLAHVQVADLATMGDRIASISFVAALPTVERTHLLAEVEALLAPHADSDGKVTMPYRTDVYWTTRTPDPRGRPDR